MCVVLTPDGIWQQETRQRASATAAGLSWLSGAHGTGNSDGVLRSYLQKARGRWETVAEPASSQSGKAKPLKIGEAVNRGSKSYKEGCGELLRGLQLVGSR